MSEVAATAAAGADAAPLAGALSDRRRHIAGDGAAPWLRERRDAAWNAFLARGLPHSRRREERYRFLDLGLLTNVAWQQPEPVRDAISLAMIPELGESARAVAIDGRPRPERTRAQALGGARLTTLAHAGEVAAHHLATAATRYGENPFLAAQSATVQDAWVLHVPAGITIAAPIVVVHGASDRADALHMPRLLAVLEDGAAAQLIEVYVGPDGVRYALNAVTEVVLGGGARLDHDRVQLDGDAGVHVAATEVHLNGPDAVYHGRGFALGGAWMRHDVNVVHAGRGGDATIDGLYVLAGAQVVDHHTRLDHMQPHTRSHELFKGVLDDRARAVFNGRIYVDRAAQKTDAYQANPNLCLTDDVVVNSNPELEIYADDVRCTHGATCGELDQQAMFYLQSRGFDRARAEALLVFAFASDVTERAPWPALRALLHDQLLRRLGAARGLGGDGL